MELMVRYSWRAPSINCSLMVMELVVNQSFWDLTVISQLILVVINAPLGQTYWSQVLVNHSVLVIIIVCTLLFFVRYYSLRSVSF